MLDVRLLGDPILRQRADEVEEIDDELRELAEEMFETMYTEEGIGLAAPQVGVSKRLFVMDIREDEAQPQAVVNPVIIEHSGSERGEEGCLSLPGLIGAVERPAHIVMEGLDLGGRPLRIEASDLLARCIQHEIDHLDGVLFIDHLSPIKRKMLLSKWKKRLKEESRR
ncbi:MAG: peptide deformylase [Gemmatimonadetes bacterium]|nr:peptide deformylase [Gemmatimonadota bacterium]NIO31587.1 peptide deformylase [Gemmatimonadota bacterium]